MPRNNLKSPLALGGGGSMMDDRVRADLYAAHCHDIASIVGAMSKALGREGFVERTNEAIDIYMERTGAATNPGPSVVPTDYYAHGFKIGDRVRVDGIGGPFHGWVIGFTEVAVVVGDDHGKRWESSPYIVTREDDGSASA